jgi:hypothetical protein
LLATSDGGYAIAGETVAAGIVDFWVVKTDEFGNEEWNRTYGGPYNEHAYALVATSDGGYAVAGSQYGDCWLVKTDASGNMEWNRTYGRESSDHARSLVATPDGGYAIAGDTEYSGLGSGAGYSDFWLIKTDESGNMELNQTYGGAGYDVAYAVVAMSDGGYALAGITSSFGAGGYDALVVRADEYGVFPEYSSWILPLILLVATSIMLVYRKKMLKSSEQTKNA